MVSRWLTKLSITQCREEIETDRTLLKRLHSVSAKAKKKGDQELLALAEETIKIVNNHLCAVKEDLKDLYGG